MSGTSAPASRSVPISGAEIAAPVPRPRLRGAAPSIACSSAVREAVEALGDVLDLHGLGRRLLGAGAARGVRWRRPRSRAGCRRRRRDSRPPPGPRSARWCGSSRVRRPSGVVVGGDLDAQVGAVLPLPVTVKSPTPSREASGCPAGPVRSRAVAVETVRVSSATAGPCGRGVDVDRERGRGGDADREGVLARHLAGAVDQKRSGAGRSWPPGADGSHRDAEVTAGDVVAELRAVGAPVPYQRADRAVGAPGRWRRGTAGRYAGGVTGCFVLGGGAWTMLVRPGAGRLRSMASWAGVRSTSGRVEVYWSSGRRARVRRRGCRRRAGRRRPGSPRVPR